MTDKKLPYLYVDISARRVIIVRSKSVDLFESL